MGGVKYNRELFICLYSKIKILIHKLECAFVIY